MGSFSDAELATEVGRAHASPGHALDALDPRSVLLRERVGRVTMLGMGLCLLVGLAAFGAGDGMIQRRAFGGALVAAGLPLLPLAFGLHLGPGHRLAPGCLLFGVPFAIAFGAFFRAGAQPSAIVFWVVAVTLLAFLVEAARLFAPVQSPSIDLDPNPKKMSALPARVRRRVRLYRVFQGAGVLAFVLPLGIALTASGTPTFAVATAGLLGAVACRAFLIDTLERHLQRDPALTQAMSKLRRHARKGRPARVFYVAAGFALLGMVLFVSRRYFSGLLP